MSAQEINQRENMLRELKNEHDELRPEYDLSKLKGGVRGKYFKQAAAGTNLGLIDPDLAKIFPDAAAVNHALRLQAKASAPARPRARVAKQGIRKGA